MATELLDELEARVREAAERIRALKEQNARLSERVGELEEQLADDDAAAERASWEHERDEVRRRLQHLTRTLEGLLEE